MVTSWLNSDRWLELLESEGIEPMVAVATELPVEATATMPVPTDTPVPPSPTPVPLATTAEVIEPDSESITSIEGLPEDIPVFPENNGDLFAQTMEGVKMFGYSTNVEYDAVEAFFSDLMPAENWELITESSAEGTTMLIYEKGSRTAMVSLTEESGVVWIQILVDEPPAE
jgi:hypothetical protein